VARLVRHLARQAAQLADVVEDHYAAGNLPVGAANRRRRELGRELAFRLFAQQERASAEVHAAPLAEALRDRIAERAAVDLVDERQEIEKPLADAGAARAADQLLRCFVHVVDRAVAVRRDHALAYRLERDPRLQLAATERSLEALAVGDVTSDGQ
jgi:hypothetical protein